VLIIPLLRFGELLASAPGFPVTLESGLALLSHGVIHAVRILATAIVHATLGWIVLAPLLTLALYYSLKPVFRRFTPANTQEAI
jgi:thiosulfate reductase cytochrome b subunit